MSTPAALRTPEDRFASLPGFPWTPRYVSVGGLRMHYVDEGPAGGETLLLLHGEPTWSYLYRRVIPVALAAGMRIVAPDFIGFGRSDKLVRAEDYSYQFHVSQLAGLLRSLDLRGLTLFGQDWGGLIGLRAVAEDPDRFDRVCVANTSLPTGSIRLPPAFFEWRDYSQRVPDLRVGRLVSRTCLRPLPPEVTAAYDAPFPDESYKTGVRSFPMLVPVDASDPAVPANEAAWRVLDRWTKPFLTAFADRDPITAGGDILFQRRVPGAQGQPHVTIRDAGHFLQEDRGEELGRVLVDFVRRNPT